MGGFHVASDRVLGSCLKIQVGHKRRLRCSGLTHMSDRPPGPPSRLYTFHRGALDVKHAYYTRDFSQ